MPRHFLGTSVPETIMAGPVASTLGPRGARARAARGTCPSGCWQQKDSSGNVYCECNYVRGAVQALRSSLSGISGGPRGPRVSVYALGDPDVYTGATKCSDIPSGDPYRAPGNFCTGNDGSQKTFDKTGNAISTGPDIVTWGLYAGAALVAYKIVTGRKKRRR